VIKQKKKEIMKLHQVHLRLFSLRNRIEKENEEKIASYGRLSCMYSNFHLMRVTEVKDIAREQKHFKKRMAETFM
jgi:hypothetical protein